MKETRTLRYRIENFIFNPVSFFSLTALTNLTWIQAASGLLISVSLHLIAFLIITHKIIAYLNNIIVEINKDYRLDPASSYGISIFGSLNIWFIWIFYILFLICLDIIFWDKGHYVQFVKQSLLAFSAMIPYLLLVLILAIIYDPATIGIPESHAIDSLLDWINGAPEKITSQLITRLIHNLEYVFDLWIVILITASYRAFSGRSFAVCCCSAIFYFLFAISLGTLTNG